MALEGKTRPRRNALGRNTWIQHKALSVTVLSCKQQKPVFCIFSMCKSSDTRFAKMFSHSFGCLFTLLTLSFEVQNAFNVHEAQFAHVLLSFMVLVSYLRNDCYSKLMEIYPYVFFSEFYSFSLTFKFLNHFAIFTYDMVCAGRCRTAQLASIRQMIGQVSRGSPGEYQADERAGVARLSWRVSDR